MTVVAALGFLGLGISALSERAEAQQLPSMSSPLFPFNYPKNSAMGLATAPVRSASKIVTQNANYAVLSTDVETEFTNTGASGQIQFSLPACTSANLGFRDTFSVAANQNIAVVTNGNDIFATPGLSGTAHKVLVSSNVAGNAVTSTCYAAGVWRANPTAGGWASN
jgi:hypothetical protein